MGLVTNEAEVCVAGRPGLTHQRTSVSISPSFLNVRRMDDDALGRERQLSTSGAHFSFLFSSEIAFQCFEQAESQFHFKGPYLGRMEEAFGRVAADEGTLAHAISEFRLSLAVDPAQNLFRLDIAGNLVPMRQGFDYWRLPKPLSNFSIKTSLPLHEAAALFSGDTAVVQPRIAKALARLDHKKE